MFGLHFRAALVVLRFGLPTLEKPAEKDRYIILRDDVELVPVVEARRKTTYDTFDTPSYGVFRTCDEAMAVFGAGVAVTEVKAYKDHAGHYWKIYPATRLLLWGEQREQKDP